eukprot:GSMAST32.ASY1.ANO1.1765.1 assembled CDS
MKPILSQLRERYDVRELFQGGSHGEVWRAIKKYVRLAGLREIYFGELLKGKPHIARFVEFFETNNTNNPNKTNTNNPNKTDEKTKSDLWLVFHDEGRSLRDFLYSRHELSSGAVYFSKIHEPSSLWRELRTGKGGLNVLRGIWLQITEGVALLHQMDITHRDLKPSNLIISLPEDVLKIADFSSAVNGHSLKFLYGMKGPSQDEETVEYQPPENKQEMKSGSPYFSDNPKTYDLWTLGVIFLEMILGTQHVFAVSARTFAKLDHKMRQEKRSDAERRQLLILTGLAEWCVFPEPNASSSEYNTMKDKNKIYLPKSRWAVDVRFQNCFFFIFSYEILYLMIFCKIYFFTMYLLWRLLRWHAWDRLPVELVLQHAFFVGPYTCDADDACTGKEFALPVRFHK